MRSSALASLFRYEARRHRLLSKAEAAMIRTHQEYQAAQEQTKEESREAAAEVRIDQQLVFSRLSGPKKQKGNA